MNRTTECEGTIEIKYEIVDLDVTSNAEQFVLKVKVEETEEELFTRSELNCENVLNEEISPNTSEKNAEKTIISDRDLVIDKTLTSRMKIHQQPSQNEEVLAEIYQSDKCKETLETNDSFLQHLQIHIDEQLNNYVCQTCGKKCRSPSDLKEHINSHTGEKPHECRFCQKRFMGKSHLHAHIKIHSGIKQFKCNECGKEFRTSWELNQHRRAKHGTDTDKPFACQICHKRFISSSYLTQHERIHSGENPFKCNECEKSFSHSGHLAEHVRTHSGERPFSCTICDKRFTRNSNLLIHMRIHSGSKPFECQICPKRFTQNICLKKHVEFYHAKNIVQ